jgi:hypothetical protein
MKFPDSPQFNPTVTKVPTLGSSSGDPTTRNDPKSVASIGANIQSIQDQANADRLYDAPVKQKTEGFEGYKPKSEGTWIVKSEACRRIQGFTDMPNKKMYYIPILASLGVVFLLLSFIYDE